MDYQDSIAKKVSECISTALNIIASHVRVENGMIHIQSAGSQGHLMNAVHSLGRAHELQPKDVTIHFAYASSLVLAMQGPAALAEMHRIAEAHPRFELAQIALRGWERWQSVFTLPVLTQDNKVPEVIARTLPVESSGLFALRDGLVPTSAVIFRNTSIFTDLAALQSADVKVTTVISEVSDPQVVGVYTRVFDNPRKPFTIEVVHTPFFPRGDDVRTIWEYFAIQQELTLIIIDHNNTIVFRKTLSFPDAMRQTNMQLLAMFQQVEGREISENEFLRAVQRHQNILPTDFAF